MIIAGFILSLLAGLGFGVVVAAWWCRVDLNHWQRRAIQAEKREWELAEQLREQRLIDPPQRRASDLRARRILVGEWHGAN